MRRILTAATLAATLAFAVPGCSQEPPPPSQKVIDYLNNRSASPTPVAQGPEVAVIGDSYTNGSDMGGNDAANWAVLAGAQLRKTDPSVSVTRKGLSGSGYVNRGQSGKVFGEAVPTTFTPATDVAVFFGSINDFSQPLPEVEAAAGSAFAATKKVAPEAQLLVIGPAWPMGEAPGEILAIRDALARATKASGGTFVDPIAERWLTDKPNLIGRDEVHPTDEGHAYLASLIAPHIQAAIAR